MALSQLNKQTSNHMKKKLAKSGQRWDSEKKKKKTGEQVPLCPAVADFCRFPSSAPLDACAPSSMNPSNVAHGLIYAHNARRFE